MNKTTMLAWIATALAVVALAVGLFHGGAAPAAPAANQQLGDATVSLFPTWYQNGIKIGPQGQTLNQILDGTCNLASGNTLAATSSTIFFCSVTGVKAGDSVDITPKVNPSGWGAFIYQGLAATTTGQIGVLIENLTGAATSSFPLATTSIGYQVFR